MSLTSRLNYYRRIGSAYLTPAKSQLTFWHETPAVNDNAQPGELGEYWQLFAEKADYSGHYDAAGIPMLDYRGIIGLQYNPIAIAQYGLANYNLYRRTGEPARRATFLKAADWLLSNLECNSFGLAVWMHHFDWEYRALLRKPWYSALAQGQGISLLVRAHLETDDRKYLEAAGRAMESFYTPIEKGGIAHIDGDGRIWFEEYLVVPFPPTHVLNGFIWATWGVYDYWLATQNPTAGELFEKAVNTIAASLGQFDTGYWSLYEQSGTRLKMLASRFYHSLHIVQLEVMWRLTGRQEFAEYRRRWQRYMDSRVKRSFALGYKALFKLCYY